MTKLSILAISIVLAVGCKKKDDKPSTSDKTTEMGMDQKAAHPETATKPGDDKKTETPVAPPAMGLEDVKLAPADAPKDCQDAYAAMKKLHDCDKVAPEAKNSMIKGWNEATSASLTQWGSATADQKTTITQSCAQLVTTAAPLTKDCP